MIHYDGKPLHLTKLSSPSRKIRAYETENIAWRSAERIFANYKLSEWKKVKVVPYEYKEGDLDEFEKAT